MNTFLQNIGWIEPLSMRFKADQKAFAAALRKRVAQRDIGFFADGFDIFSSGNQRFKGQVTDDGFVLKFKRQLMDRYSSSALAEGTFRTEGDMVVIEGEIRGLHGYFLAFITISVVMFFGTTVLAFHPGVQNMWVMLLVWLFQGAIFYGFVNFFISLSISRLKDQLELLLLAVAGDVVKKN